jgi:APA family basic amino acid/polyamine antiporter
MDNFVGDATKYVVSKAPCEVILTAPPASDVPIGQADDPEQHPAPASDPSPPHDQSISAAPPLIDPRRGA